MTGSYLQKMSNWETRSVVAKDRELLNKGGLKHRFDRTLKNGRSGFPAWSSGLR